MRVRLLPLVFLVLAGTAGCTGTLPPPATLVVAESFVREELYFGMRKLDGSLVAEAEWQAFVDSVVTPRFPRGLTVLAGYGQYQPRGRPLVREPTRVLILVHRREPEVERSLREIAAIYCRRFQQESVMRVTDPVFTEFLGADADSTAEGGPRGAFRVPSSVQSP